MNLTNFDGFLQVNDQQKMASGSAGGLGTYMGWAMAVIYMGGRLPQIRLNIRRGHVEVSTETISYFHPVANN
ncbi:Lysosomal amino acid transporter 1 [Bienertia sinuspersici]